MGRTEQEYTIRVYSILLCIAVSSFRRGHIEQGYNLRFYLKNSVLLCIVSWALPDNRFLSRLLCTHQ